MSPPASLTPEVRQGYRLAREVARVHARSFYFASHLLFGARRRAAFALYAFCRRLDDLVDGESHDEGADSRGVAAPVPGPALAQRLAVARRLVSALYAASDSELTRGLVTTAPWPAAEFAALRETLERYQIPEKPLQDLISGMEMDLTQNRYPSYEDLNLYCYRVAGTVGLMMAPVLGCSEPAALWNAAELGRAMQLTNILRDIPEDLARGRIYLPSQELAGFGVTEEQLAQGRVDTHFRNLMRFQIDRARKAYQSGAKGIPALDAFGAKSMVRLMAALYGGILTAIERNDYDVFRQRAHVQPARKLALAAGALASLG